MSTAPLPDNEAQRLEALSQYQILDSTAEAAFDDLTRLASYICGTPIALVSLVDANRQWFKSKVGLEALETPRDLAFCAHAIVQPEIFIVPDATTDERFAANPLVTSDPNVRFYAGVPLINAEGYGLGTLCVIDRVPRELTPEQVEALRILGRQVLRQMELRRNLANLVFTNQKPQYIKKTRIQFFKKIAGGFGLASAILVLIGIISYQNNKVFIDISNQAIRTQNNIDTAEKILSLMKDAETGQRGYLLTGEKSYLEPYQVALAQIARQIKTLKYLTTDQPNQQKQILNLEQFITAKLAFIKQTIDLRQKKGFDAALQVIQTNRGKNLMDDIRQIIREMEDEEKALLQQQSKAAMISRQSTILTLAIAIGLCFVILTVVYYFIYREVTERTRTEEILKKERNFISAVLDTAGALVIVLDSQGLIVRFNQACEQTTGYSFNEVRGRYFWNLFIIPEEIEPVKAVFERLRFGQQLNDHENYWVMKDGSRRLIAWSNTILKDDEGAVEYVIGIGIDINERKQAEEKLLESQTRIQLVNSILTDINSDISVNQIIEHTVNQLSSYFNSLRVAYSTIDEQGNLTVLYSIEPPGMVKLSGLTADLTAAPEYTNALRVSPVVIVEDVATDSRLIYLADAMKINSTQALLDVPLQHSEKLAGLLSLDSPFPRKWSQHEISTLKEVASYLTVAIREANAQQQRSLAVNALKESEQRWQLALRGNNDGIWDWNVKTSEVFFSTRWKEMLGYKEHEISNHLEEWSKRVHSDDLDSVTQLIQDHFAKKTPFYISEYRVLCKNGSYKWILDRGQALWDEEGNPVRMAGSHTDITERKRVEESLERERRQLQEIITCAPVAMAMFDTEMRYLAHSNKWRTDYGIQKQSIINHNHYEVFLDVPEQWKAIHQRALQGEAISNSEDIFERENGSKVYLRWAIHPWLNHNAEVGGIIIVTDVINELVEAREAAVEASNFKSRFLANMSHEIRTPMNAVLGMTGLLLETALNPEQRDFVETIRISGDALLSLINEILDLSKLEAGEMMLETLDFDLSTCVEEVLDLLAPQAHNKGLEIAALIYRNVPTHLQGDASRLRQILMNLISNAIKFTSTGEILIRVELRSQTPTTATIHFAITDTGLGITPENQGKLFQPFTQVDASTTRKYGGTGLGLAICKQLVTLMGGEIGVESQLGQGSQFWFEVTFAKQLQPVSTISDRGLLNNRRLLVVDDNATNRKIIYHQATHWGMQVDQAESAAVALSVIQEACEQNQPYDVILIDMQMPETDGMTLGAQIKATSTIAEIPLIMLTSTNQRDEVKRALKIGFAAYLVKPVKPSRLLDTIMNILETQSESDNSKASNIAHPSTCPKNKQPNISTKSQLRILLAEDNLVNQKVALKQLQSLGYSADVAANGQEVLQLLEKIPYDLILMDCQMPILDGLDTTREIHRWQSSAFASHRRPVVIAMTANAMKEDRQMCLDAGMDDYLSKPVMKEKLAAALEYWASVIFKTHNTDASEQIESSINTDALDLPLNWEHLHQLSENNAEFELELLQLFVEDSQSHLEAAKIAIATNDFQQLLKESHHLKGASANVGAIAMQQAAEKLEKLGYSQELQDTAKLVQDLENFLHLIQVYLNDKLLN